MSTVLAGAVISSSLVLGASVTDLRCRRIPNVLTGLGAVAAVGWLCLANPEVLPERAVALGAVVLPLGVLSLGRPGSFGMGDVKLIAVLTLVMGWPVLPVVLVPAMAGAALFGLGWAAFRKARLAEMSLPLAPFIALPTLVWSVLMIQG